MLFLEDTYNTLVSLSVQHQHPLFDFLTAFTPRRLKAMFLYCEYLYYNSPQIFSTLKKFALYPITDFRLETPQPKLRESYKKLLEKDIKLKNHLVAAATDRYIYGNSFTSIHFPFQRFLECPKCGHKVNMSHIEYKAKVVSKRIEFRYTCPNCNASVLGTVVDVYVKDTSKIKLIRWDPKNMEIDSNEITGESTYYYNIPNVLQNKIMNSDRNALETTPMAFLAAVAARKIFEFAPGKIFHLKTDAPAGVSTRWGIPPLVSAVKQFLYVATLRKANEAIALEYITPMRILHPAQGTSASDPTLAISMSNWIDQMKFNIRAWRRDPLHIMFSPVPLGISQLGGQGRGMLLSGEIAEAEASILVSMGVPKEFVYGGFQSSGGVILRILENQLLNDTSSMVELAQWVVDSIANFMSWPRTKIELEPFKLVDDVQQKMTMLQANDATGGTLLSRTSLAAMFGRELETERKLRLQEALDEQKFQAELQRRLQEQQRRLEAEMGPPQAQGLNYDQQAVIASAQQIVNEVLQMDEGMRRSRLHELQMEDFVMYSVVIQLLEQARVSQAAEIRSQIQRQPPPGM